MIDYMYIDRGVGGREENNGVALKEIDSNEESPVGASRPLYTYLPRGQISYSPWPRAMIMSWL